ncbi:hypothetical protein ACERNI_15085 [Camelimonas sp. ID_303_24]
MMTARISLAALAGLALCSGGALAADLPAAAPGPASLAPSPWTFSVMPYGWLPALNGSTTVRGRTVDINASIDQVLDRKIPEQLFGMMGAFEARRDRFSVMADLAYMKLGADGGGVRSVQPQVGGEVGARASVQFQMVIAEVALGYELFRVTSGESETALDIYGGGRFWWQNIEADLDLAAGLNIDGLAIRRGRAFAKSGDVTWVDPLVGLRLRHRFSPKLDMVLRGDVGGFGAGSKFSWQAMGYVNWEFARTERAAWSAMIGYRALYVDYETGAGNKLYRYDMLTHGPILGVTARF